MLNLPVVICDIETLFQSIALLSMYLIFILYRKQNPSARQSNEYLRLKQRRLEIAQQYLNTYTSQNEDYFLTNLKSNSSHASLT